MTCFVHQCIWYSKGTNHQTFVHQCIWRYKELLFTYVSAAPRSQPVNYFFEELRIGVRGAFWKEYCKRTWKGKDFPSSYVSNSMPWSISAKYSFTLTGAPISPPPQTPQKSNGWPPPEKHKLCNLIVELCQTSQYECLSVQWSTHKSSLPLSLVRIFSTPSSTAPQDCVCTAVCGTKDLWIGLSKPCLWYFSSCKNKLGQLKYFWSMEGKRSQTRDTSIQQGPTDLSSISRRWSGVFNIRFSGTKVWYSLASGSFKAWLKSNLIARY